MAQTYKGGKPFSLGPEIGIRLVPYASPITPDPLAVPPANPLLPGVDLQMRDLKLAKWDPFLQQMPTRSLIINPLSGIPRG